MMPLRTGYNKDFKAASSCWVSRSRVSFLAWPMLTGPCTKARASNSMMSVSLFFHLSYYQRNQGLVVQLLRGFHSNPKSMAFGAWCGFRLGCRNSSLWWNTTREHLYRGLLPTAQSFFPYSFILPGLAVEILVCRNYSGSKQALDRGQFRVSRTNEGTLKSHDSEKFPHPSRRYTGVARVRLKSGHPLSGYHVWRLHPLSKNGQRQEER